MHPVKRFCLCAFALAALLPHPTSATLIAQTLDGWTGSANLIYSRMTIQVAAEWIDVEEEAEIQAIPGWSGDEGPWIVQGTFSVPKGTAITGCMLWNGDTLLMGKLRGKVQANKIFDSLVPPVTTRWPVDPLLVEQVSDTVYNLKLYPFETNGSRRFRLRYLVPRQPGTTVVPVKPLMAGSVNGTTPDEFRLRLRGDATGLRLASSGGVWPLDLPFSDMVAISTNPQLLWEKTSNNAVRGNIESGAWAGDYVMFSGAVPDSIVRNTAIRSETVVLWNWIDPSSFFNAYGYYDSRYLSSLGSEAISQAARIDLIAERAGSNGGKMGLVADLGQGDSPRTYPMADSTASTFKAMRKWLQGIDESYLASLVPALSSNSSGGIVSNADAAKIRQRFRVDVRKVASMYSADSGVIRHLVVVTAGISASFASLEEVDPSLLPQDVSVTSSRLVANGYTYQYDYARGTYTYVNNPPTAATWPGIDLAGLVASRPGTDHLVDWNGIALPKIRSLSAARLSIGSGSSTIRRNALLSRGVDGKLRGTMNVHAPSLGKSMQWEVFDDSGKALSSWTETPSWSDVGKDSILPRLWAKSASPIAPAFEDKDLGPIFGVIDMYNSLLATPSDTVGAIRQAALRDSGVPFLTYAEIFPRQGYGLEGTSGNSEGSAIHEKASRNALHLSWLAGTRTLRIDLDGLEAQGIEIRDLRGRLVASFSAAQLAGLKFLEWHVPARLSHGVLLVSVRTATGMQSGRLMIP